MSQLIKGVVQIVPGLYSEFLGNDTVTVAKGIFSTKIRADVMCKNHINLKPIYNEVKSYYDECWSNGRKEHKKSILTKLGVYTLTWKCSYDIFSNTITTGVSHRPLCAKESAHFESMEKSKKELGYK